MLMIFAASSFACTGLRGAAAEPAPGVGAAPEALGCLADARGDGVVVGLDVAGRGGGAVGAGAVRPLAHSGDDASGGLIKSVASFMCMSLSFYASLTPMPSIPDVRGLAGGAGAARGRGGRGRLGRRRGVRRVRPDPRPLQARGTLSSRSECRRCLCFIASSTTPPSHTGGARRPPVPRLHPAGGRQHGGRAAGPHAHRHLPRRACLRPGAWHVCGG